MIDLDNPQIIRWLNPDNGAESWTPDPTWKRELILDYARRYNLRTFVETGTYAGDTVEYVRQSFDQVHSIELSEDWYRKCQKKFKGCPNVHLYNGDSGEILKDILLSLGETPLLLYLDAHYSSGDTAEGCDPLEKELEAFFGGGATGVVMIDDQQISSRFALQIAAGRDWKSENKFSVLVLTPR